jgi:Ca2+-binding RTX toxin-like protein
VNGGIGDDIIDGGTGRDVISGDSGDDVLITGEGNDWIYTGEGGDRILAQDGSDTPGIDIGVDKVYDFTRGEDKIDLSEFFQNPANPFLPTIPIAQPLAYDFDDQIGAALSPTSLGVKVDLSLIDGGTNDGGIDGPDGSGVIHVLGVSELSEDDFVVTSQLVPVDLLL